MSDVVEMILVSPMVDVGDSAHVRVRCPADATFEGRLELRCHVNSAAPVDSTVVERPVAVLAGGDVTLALTVPEQGPITARGASLSWSWTVDLVDRAGSTMARSPVVVTPRGGVALWLQRHAAPPT